MPRMRMSRRRKVMSVLRERTGQMPCEKNPSNLAASISSRIRESCQLGSRSTDDAVSHLPHPDRIRHSEAPNIL